MFNMARLYTSIVGGVVGLVLALAASVEAGTTRGDYPACFTEAAYKEALQALSARDAQWFRSIKGCMISKRGLKVQTVDRTWTGGCKVRMWTADGANSLVLWTPCENVVE